MTEVTTIELLPGWKPIEIGSVLTDGVDNYVRVTKILKVENLGGHTYVQAEVEFL